MTVSVGIDKIGVYIPQKYVSLEELAHARGDDPNKYLIGIGQEKMAVPLIEQDIVAMGANAAKTILNEEDLAEIDQVIFATESAFDFSKAAAIYLHELLDIQPYAKAYEIKQACYGTTAGIQSACDYVRLRPDRKVLVVSSDIARYGLNTSGEVTQGAGAVAVLISANPRILAISSESVSVTSNQFDFWRPYYSEVAMVDGHFSTQLYQELFVKAVQRLEELNPSHLQQIKSMIFHLPFTKMGKKAIKLYEETESEFLEQEFKDQLLKKWLDKYESSTVLNRQVGNIYTGSLYLSLVSSLIYSESLQTNDTIALFSYGSGAVGELMTATIQPNYLDQLNKELLNQHMNRREKISVEEYEAIFQNTLPISDEIESISEGTEGEGFYLSKIDAHRRYYDFR